MYIVGQTPAALRQISAAAFAGITPQNATPVVFTPYVIDHLLTYTNPNDRQEDALAQGGLFDFGDAQAARVLEIRALTALGNISAIVADRQDQKTVTLTIGGAAPAINLVALGVVAGDIVTVISSGVTETYTVVQVDSALILQTEEIVSDRALVATDIFTITDAKGTTVRYTHTFAGVETLDINVATTHDTPVGTPIASRLIFIAPLTVAPHQVLKVSTVGASALGWVDVYAVKADFY